MSDHDLSSGYAPDVTGRIDPAPTDALLPVAERLFGDRLPLAVRYAEVLINDGVTRGLIGPREAPRIWQRHLLNCAAVAELIEPGSTVADVGSGAGLPGIVLSLARPDLSVVLIESLARRTAFLSETVQNLGLERTVVVRARAEEYAVSQRTAGSSPIDVVTARAVAPLDRLAAWCLPIVVPGGRLLALKGASADEEIQAHQDAIGRLGGGVPAIRLCGVGLLDEPTTVVEILRERVVGPVGKGRSSGHRAKSSVRGRRGGQRR